MQVLCRHPVAKGPRLQVWTNYDHPVRMGVEIERVRCNPRGGAVEVRAPVQVVANPGPRCGPCAWTSVVRTTSP